MKTTLKRLQDSPFLARKLNDLTAIPIPKGKLKLDVNKGAPVREQYTRSNDATSGPFAPDETGRNLRLQLAVRK